MESKGNEKLGAKRKKSNGEGRLARQRSTGSTNPGKQKQEAQERPTRTYAYKSRQRGTRAIHTHRVL